MTAAKRKVGDVLEVPSDAQVERPDGTVSTVTGGTYVLDKPGTFKVGDREVVVT